MTARQSIRLKIGDDFFDSPQDKFECWERVATMRRVDSFAEGNYTPTGESDLPYSCAASVVAPFEWGDDMSVACALYSGDTLYLAADSAVGELPTKASTDKKIDYSEAVPLAWATAGDEAIGDQLGEWLKIWLASPNTNIASLTWDLIVEQCVLRLAAFNGVRSEAARLNGVPRNPGNAFCQVMMVGFIGNRPEIVHLEVSGGWTLHILAGRNFATMGAGAVHAAMAYEVLNGRGALPVDALACIREVAELAAAHAPLCALPVNIVRVTRDGVERIANATGGAR